MGSLYELLKGKLNTIEVNGETLYIAEGDTLLDDEQLKLYAEVREKEIEVREAAKKADAAGYGSSRLEVSHGDLYRLGDPGEIQELGLEEAWLRGALLVEWPERAPWLWPAERLTVRLEPVPEGGPGARRARLEGAGRWAGALPWLAGEDRSR